MKAGYRSALAAWYVAGSLLLRCCCRCYSFTSFGHHPQLRWGSRTATSTKNIGVGCVHRRWGNGRPLSCSRQGAGVRRIRAPVGAFGEEVGDAAGAAAEAAGAALVLSRPIVRVVLPEGRGLRVHSMSDLHTDSSANAAWIKTWASWKGCDSGELGEAHEDVLIVAGDISSSLERTAETLTDLKARYDEVFFVVGNHEMWTGGRTSTAKEGGEGELEGISSVDKLVQLHRMCENLGVRTDPVIFVVGERGAGGAKEEGVSVEEEGVPGERPAAEGGLVVRGRQELAVFPLLSWYHASWDSEPNLPPELQLRRGDFLRRWRDYSWCQWPEDLCSREDFVTVDRDAPPLIAEFFARQNNACIEAFRSKGGDAAEAPLSSKDGGSRSSSGSSGGGGGSGGGDGGGSASTKVISFSHFVPRQELCPEKRLLWEPQLTKVIGSDPLERQIRELGSDVHIFGHTHIPIDMTSDGVRYVQWPLGSLREQSYRTNDMREKGPLLVYSHDGHEGGLRPPVHTLWGEFYEAFPRDPHDTEIPENTYEYMKQRIAEGRARRARGSSGSPQLPGSLV